MRERAAAEAAARLGARRGTHLGTHPAPRPGDRRATDRRAAGGLDPSALVEREAPLGWLADRLKRLLAVDAAGGCVLVHGEEGVGKTSLLRAARAASQAKCDWLVGLCEPLLSPSPLSPWLDMQEGLPPSLAASLNSGRPMQDWLPELLAWLRRLRRPLVIWVDDAQWADSASLNALRFIGRRCESLRVLLILSYRDNALPPEHPLHAVIGALPAKATRHLSLGPLSAESVAGLARAWGRDAKGLHALTQGNPFYVTELLAAAPGSLPASLRDAVLARVQHASIEVRRILDLACVSPLALARQTLLQLGCQDDGAWRECRLTGLLEEARTEGAVGAGGTIGADGADGVRFRHEMARRAYESMLTPGHRLALHTLLLQALPPQAAAQRLHHAVGAGLTDEVAALAPQAAAQAAQASAYREAASLYATALAHAEQASPGQRAVWLSAHANQCELIAQLDDSLRSRGQAIALYRRLDQPKALGRELCLLARLHWLGGDAELAKTTARRSIEVLEPLGSGAELAAAYSVLAQSHLLDPSSREVLLWGRRAMAMAESAGDLETLAHALSSVGASELNSADHMGSWQHLQRSLSLALAHGWPLLAARAYINLVAQSLVHRKVERWQALFDDAMAYCDARDMDNFSAKLRLRRAYTWLETGRWADAERALAAFSAAPGLTEMDRQQGVFVQAWLGLRRSGPETAPARRYWAAMLSGQRQLKPQPWYATPVLGLVEAAWLSAGRAGMVRLLDDAWAQALLAGEPWRIGMLLVWMRRIDLLDQRPGVMQAVPGGSLQGLPAPCAAELRGDLDAAAQAWALLRHPYQQAVCLLGGDVAQLRSSLEILQRLGARPVAALARARLRQCGQARGLRGLNLATRNDPQGLTPRQRSLLGDLAQGLGDRQIAERQHRSPRTVEHQVATLLRKLGLRSRRDVAGWVAQHRS